MDNTADPETILLVGAGRGADLGRHVARGVRRIIATEADPRLLDGLTQRAAPYPNVTIEPVSAALSHGEAELRQMNFPEASSIFRPTGIKSMFPGLSEAGVSTVTCKPIVDLAADALNGLSGPAHLHLRSNGAELDLLGALAKSELLDRFCHVEVECGVEPLYEQASSAAELSEFLTRQGFSVREESGAGKFRRIIATGEPEARKNALLEGQLETAKAEAASFAEELKKTREDSEAALKQAETERDKALEEARSQSARLKDLEAALAKAEDRVSRREEQRDALDARQKELEETLQDARSKSDWRGRELEKLRDRIGELERSLQEAESARLTRDEELETLKRSLLEAEKERDEHSKLEAAAVKDAEEKERLLKEVDQRRALLDSEFVRAEAQIDLITDILIRQKAF